MTPLGVLALFAAGRPLGLTAILVSLGLALNVGHYLPGMLRAYGDREIFRRFRTRLIVAPLLFVGAASAAAWVGLQALELLILLWGPWHWLMQTYGFARIYDARAGVTDATTARLDYALIVLLFGSALLLTESFSNPLRDVYALGVPPIPVAGVAALRALWIGATLAVLALFGLHVARSIRRGAPPSRQKLLLIAVTVPFFAYTASLAQTPLQAFVLFELCHDAQYLALVWMINRNRVERDEGGGTGRLMRLLFRPRAALAAAYLALCLAFGALGPAVHGWIRDPALQRIALGAIAVFALMHYYLDGFIWKIREPTNRASLDLSAQPIAPASTPKALRALLGGRGLRHAALWVAVALPVGAIAVIESRGTRPDGRRLESHLSEAFPNAPLPHLNLCRALLDTREFDRAQWHCERALELSPDWATAHNNLGVAVAQQGDLARAERELRRAVEIDPDYFQARGNLERVVQERRRRARH